MANECSERQKVRIDQITYGLSSQAQESVLYPRCNEASLKRKSTIVPLGRMDKTERARST